MIYKVISDNGYKIELIRPIRSETFILGQVVTIEAKKSPCDLVKLFDGLLDEETMNLIFDKFNEAKKADKSAEVQAS